MFKIQAGKRRFLNSRAPIETSPPQHGRARKCRVSVQVRVFLLDFVPKGTLLVQKGTVFDRFFSPKRADLLGFLRIPGGAALGSLSWTL